MQLDISKRRIVYHNQYDIVLLVCHTVENVVIKKAC